MCEDYEEEFHAYVNEDVDTADSRGKIIGRTKPTIIITHMCKLFCRGAECKYCKPESRFFGDEMVIEGLYSSWVTSNILAMARPSTNNMDQYAVVDQFINVSIKTVINMQKPGEHNYCGHVLHESGFSYDPYIFMNSGIDYLNFPCEDYGVLRVEYLLDITKIMQHQLTRGKIAVHCHAGLGRTGLVIACYLIFNNRLSGIDSINYVRSKRRNSIQNSTQVNKILEFHSYLESFRCVIWTPTCNLYRFSLQEAVLRQKKLVHGKEAYILHFIPKVLYLCLRKISQMAQGVEKNENDLFDSQEYPSIDNSCLDDQVNDPYPKVNSKIVHNFIRWNNKIRFYFNKIISEENAQQILERFTSHYSNTTELDSIKQELNSTDETWRRLYQIDDMHLHCQLVMDYLDVLKFPVLRTPDLEMLNAHCDDNPLLNLLKLETCVGRTLAIFLAFINQCKSLQSSEMSQLRSIIFSRLTHKTINFGINNLDSEICGQCHLFLSSNLTDSLRSFLTLV